MSSRVHRKKKNDMSCQLGLSSLFIIVIPFLFQYKFLAWNSVMVILTATLFLYAKGHERKVTTFIWTGIMSTWYNGTWKFCGRMLCSYSHRTIPDLAYFVGLTHLGHIKTLIRNQHCTSSKVNTSFKAQSLTFICILTIFIYILTEYDRWRLEHTS